MSCKLSEEEEEKQGKYIFIWKALLFLSFGNGGLFLRNISIIEVFFFYFKIECPKARLNSLKLN